MQNKNKDKGPKDNVKAKPKRTKRGRNKISTRRTKTKRRGPFLGNNYDSEWLLKLSFYVIKQFVVKKLYVKIVTETLKNGILIPIVTSKESHFHTDFKLIIYFYPVALLFSSK